ncbi:hypothetical protein EAH81_10555 [Flavobacterium pectinovorum]|uniref:Uncharacterized protein n=1 Tax=Flavobacterium pectinovorum TaxID=29533 RepID=A0A502ESI1_9FLAO|nr:hypothetical protein EAH81_10555 [Flavobacterium pectinovorum]
MKQIKGLKRLKKIFKAKNLLNLREKLYTQLCDLLKVKRFLEVTKTTDYNTNFLRSYVENQS